MLGLATREEGEEGFPGSADVGGMLCGREAWVHALWHLVVRYAVGAVRVAKRGFGVWQPHTMANLGCVTKVGRFP